MDLKQLFGFRFKKSDQKPSEVEPQKSFVPPEGDDGSISVEAGGFYGQYLDLDGTVRSDREMIQKYREMAAHPEVETAVEDIVTEAIVGEENEQPVKIILDGLDIKQSIKEKITEEFGNVLDLMNFYTKGYELFRRWYVDSKLVYHVIIDKDRQNEGIKELRYIDPINIQKVKQYKRESLPNGTKVITGSEEYYVYNKDGFKDGNATGLKISPDSICYVTSGLYDSRNRRTIGYLHKAIKPLNQLRMMEDALVIYRISRAPERRVFYVDVGNLPKLKAEAYVRDLMNRYKNKLTYDASTGEIRDDRRFQSVLEDFWMPRREGGKGTQIETLKGGENLSELGDVEYFQKKVYKALNVPMSRNQEQKSFSIGKSTEISRDEVKFGKFITRLRFKFSETFYNLLRTQLILKNIISADDWEEYKSKIHFDFLKDNYFSELKQSQIIRERVELLAEIDNFKGIYYSKEWIMTHILKLNEEEKATMLVQMEQENAEEKEKQEEEMIRQAEMSMRINPSPDGQDPGMDMPPEQSDQPTPQPEI